MHIFCAVCSFSVALCLVVCVSAKTEVAAEGAAKAAVEQAKQSVTEVHERAQSELNKANDLLRRVKSSKDKAEDAKVKSQKAPQDNTDAVAIATTVKSLSEEVDKLYVTEKQKLNNAVNTLNPLLSEAETLNGKPDIKIEPDTESSEDYTKTNSEAAALKEEATKLNGKIDAAIEPIAGVGAKAEEMETKAKEAQLKDAHVSVIVDVATIHTLLGNAATIIGQIEGKKNEVSGIFGEMQTLKTTHPTVSDKNIEALQQSAANALKDATDALDSAKIAKTAIQTQKGIANEALTKVQPETQKEVSEAQKEVQKAQDCVRAAQQSFLQIENALQTATNSVTSAKDLKKKLEKALSTTTTEQNTQQSKGKEETNLPVADSTDSHQKDTTIQTTSKELPSQRNSTAEKLKDKLTKEAQNVPPTALTGGKAPAPGAKNDSAMTVSVPLLVALIASAVLQ